MALPGLVAAVVVLLVLAVSLLAFLAAAAAVGPPEDDVTPEEPYERVRVRRAEAPDLVGWWVPAARETRSAVLCLHGHPRSKEAILETVRFLREDHHLLLVDLRAHGESQGRFTTFGDEEVRDVQAAVSYLQDRPEVDRMGAWGVSMGAATLLLAADPRLDAVVAEAPYAELREAVSVPGPAFLDEGVRVLFSAWARLLLDLDPAAVRPEEAAGDLPFPLLLIHGTEDGTVPLEHARRIAEAGGEAVETWFVEGAGHDACHEDEPEEYERRVRAFLDENLGSEGEPKEN